MHELPIGLHHYNSTPVFDESSIPAGLLGEHTTKAGTWGRIVVLEGTLRYEILEPTSESLLLTPGIPGIVAPGVKHRVEPVGAVKFQVEFLREP